MSASDARLIAPAKSETSAAGSPHKLVKHPLLHDEALRPRAVLAARLEGAAQRGGQHLRRGRGMEGGS